MTRNPLMNLAKFGLASRRHPQAARDAARRGIGLRPSRWRPAPESLEDRLTPTLLSPFNTSFVESVAASNLAVSYSGSVPYGLTVDPATRTFYYADANTSGNLYQLNSTH